MKSRFYSWLIAALVFPLTFASCQNSADRPTHKSSGTIAMIGGSWIDGTSFVRSTRYIANGVFVDSITGSADSTIDLTDKFIVPPYADAHSHLFSQPSELTTQLARHLGDGIYYIKNPHNVRSSAEEVRPALFESNTVEVTYAHGGLTASGGHPVQIFLAAHGSSDHSHEEGDLDGDAYFIINNEEDLNQKWPSIVAGKPDFIKVYLEYSEEYEKRKNDPSYYGKRGLNPALIPLIVQKAEDSNLTVSAHVNTSADYAAAVKAGVHEINHLPLEIISGELAQKSAAAGVTIVTTALSHRPSSHVTDLDLVHETNLKRLIRAGVKIILGTDNGNITVVDEAIKIDGYGVMQRADLLTNLCVLTPQAIYPDRQIGEFKSGFEASFLALNSNPLDDLNALRDVALRVKQGRVIVPPVSDQKPHVANVLIQTLMSNGIKAALAQYDELKETQPDEYEYGPNQLNAVGYAMLNHGQHDGALAMLEATMERYPGYANGYDSMADVFIAMNKPARAEECYQKVIDILSKSHRLSDFDKGLLDKAKKQVGK